MTKGHSVQRANLGEGYFDFVVVGGGVVGCVAALALLHAGKTRGWRIALAENRPMVPGKLPPESGRAFWLSHSTKKLFERLGLWCELEPNLCVIHQIQMLGDWSGDSVRMDESDHQAGPLGFMVEERALVSVLMRQIFAEVQDSPDGADSTERFALFDATATKLERAGNSGGERAQLSLWKKNHPQYPQHPQHAQHPQHPQHPQHASSWNEGSAAETGTVISAQVVVGCDGNASATRTAAGIQARRVDYQQRNLVASLVLPAPHRGICNQFVVPTGPLALLPLGTDRASLAWTLPRNIGLEVEALSQDEQEQRLRAVLPAELDGLRLRTPMRGFDLAMSVARDTHCGRLALVGDSYRSVHPLLGQGFNWGARDVAGLVEAMVWGADLGLSLGSAEIFRRYAASRSFDTASISVVTDQMVRAFGADATLGRAAGTCLSVLSQVPLVRRFLVSKADGALADTLRGEW